jgi:hypothetical protein
MDDLKKQIEEARKSGYKDDEIMQHLSQTPDVGPLIGEAISNNYTPSEVLKYLTERKSASFEAGAKKSYLE